MLQKITNAVNAISDNGWAFLLCCLAGVLVLVALGLSALQKLTDNHFTALLAFAGTIVTGAFAMFHGKHPGEKDTKE